VKPSMAMRPFQFSALGEGGGGAAAAQQAGRQAGLKLVHTSFHVKLLSLRHIGSRVL
jgi:hypothetical protein